MFTTENEETQPHVNPESRRYLERIKERLFRQVASVIRTRARPIAAPFILSFASNVADRPPPTPSIDARRANPPLSPILHPIPLRFGSPPPRYVHVRGTRVCIFNPHSEA